VIGQNTRMQAAGARQLCVLDPRHTAPQCNVQPNPTAAPVYKLHAQQTPQRSARSVAKRRLERCSATEGLQSSTEATKPTNHRSGVTSQQDQQYGY